MKSRRLRLIHNARVVTSDGVTEATWLRLDGATIAEMGTSHPPIVAPTDALDARGSLLLPGFLDTHMHGAGGSDSMSPTKDSFETIARTMPRYGVTAFCLALPPASRETTLAACRLAANIKKNPSPDAAELLGIHWESPFTNHGYKGAFDESQMRDPDVAYAQEVLDAAAGSLRIVTLAPELPGALDLIKMFVDHGVTVSLGHSGATYEEASAAIAAGATRATHVFNAMAGFSHREPGILGAFLDTDHGEIELICDGFHVHPTTARAIMRLFAPQRVILVTDSIGATGTTLKRVEVAPGMIAEIREGRTWLPPKGILVGSVLTLDKAVQNLTSWESLALPEIVKVSSTNAARSIGELRKGSISVGSDADLVILDDSKRVLNTIVRGRLVYEQP